MDSLDVAVLPYRPSDYVERTSGVFSDLLGRGVIPVMPAGTWMADVAAELGVGVAYQPYDAEQLSNAVAQVAHDVAAFRAKSTRAAAQWRAENNAHAFFERLEEILRSASSPPA